MKNLKLFETHQQYEAAESSLILPNVSFCLDTPNVVHYNPYVPETRVVTKYDVPWQSYGKVRIGYENYLSGFSSIEIDGVELPSVVSSYTFTTYVEHTIIYALTDPAIIGERAFYVCSAMTSVEIPNNVTSIGSNAFYQCKGLTNIDIPSGVTSIGSLAFYYCSGLTSITVESPTPPSLGNDAFTYTNNCPIYVPSGSVEDYKAASGWSTYANRIQAMP